jgi:hypothetical protein
MLERKWPAPLLRGDAGQAALSPPERFFALVQDVAAGHTDIVQIAIRPFRQFPALAHPVAPNMNGFLDLCPKPGTMIIYHWLL